MTATQSGLTDMTDLGTALLIVEFEDDSYEPISAISTLREARELAADDLRRRMGRLDAGQEPACPVVYKVWTRTSTGSYAVASELMGVVD